MNDDPRHEEVDEEDEYEDFITDDTEDPRRRQFDDEYNERNDYTRKDYDEYAAWDTDDYEDWAREHGDFDVPAKRERDER